jgi:hypothetical protein
MANDLKLQPDDVASLAAIYNITLEKMVDLLQKDHEQQTVKQAAAKMSKNILDDCDEDDNGVRLVGSFDVRKAVVPVCDKCDKAILPGHGVVLSTEVMGYVGTVLNNVPAVTPVAGSRDRATAYHAGCLIKLVTDFVVESR